MVIAALTLSLHLISFVGLIYSHHATGVKIKSAEGKEVALNPGQMLKGMRNVGTHVLFTHLSTCTYLLARRRRDFVEYLVDFQLLRSPYFRGS
jgi:hypothetical protein